MAPVDVRALRAYTAKISGDSLTSWERRTRASVRVYRDCMQPDPPRPRVAGYFAEPDEKAAPLLHAIGRAVWAIGALEKALLLEYARLQAESAGLGPEIARELSRLERLSAGALREELQKFNLPGDLDERIDSAIQRRNRLIHHHFEDPELVRAVATGEGLADVVERVDRLALDCGELAVELYSVAAPRLEEVLGMSLSEMFKLFESVDPSTVVNKHERKQLEAILALGEMDLTELDLP
jgi:hypothetical protein